MRKIKLNIKNLILLGIIISASVGVQSVLGADVKRIAVLPFNISSAKDMSC